MLPFLTWQISITLTHVTYNFDDIFFLILALTFFFTINLETSKNCVEGDKRGLCFHAAFLSVV